MEPPWKNRCFQFKFLCRNLRCFINSMSSEMVKQAIKPLLQTIEIPMRVILLSERLQDWYGNSAWRGFNHTLLITSCLLNSTKHSPQALYNLVVCQDGYIILVRHHRLDDVDGSLSH